MDSAGIVSVNRNDSLRRRLISAVIGIPTLLLFIWAGGLWFIAGVVAVSLFGLLEFYRLSHVQRLWLQRGPGIVLTVLLVLNGHWGVASHPLLVGGALITLPLSYLWTPLSAREWIRSIAGPLYLGGTLAYAVLLRDLDGGGQWVALALFATFSVDTVAYFTGKAVGHHPMAPRISPGKTWEGAVAGLIAGIVATIILIAILELPIGLMAGALLGVGIGFVAQVGDLLESTLKRFAKAKEASSLIPGHGGFLDRLDSVVFTLLLVYYGTV